MRALLGVLLTLGVIAVTVYGMQDLGNEAQLASPREIGSGRDVAGHQPSAAAHAIDGGASPEQVTAVSPSDATATVTVARQPLHVERARPNPFAVREDIDGASLVALQQELRRVGCFRGAVGQSWATTQPAMQAFLARVNASLPTNRPDQVLLTMVRAYSGKACGAGCPIGQTLADGRCLPDAMITHRTTKPVGASRHASVHQGGAVTTSVTPSASDATATPEAAPQAPQSAGRRRPPQQVQRRRVRDGGWVRRAFGENGY